IQSSAWRLAPVCLVTHGRVAVQDEIAAALGAQTSLILIGERPGLGAPDSLGAYLCYCGEGKSSRTDADRNCIPNIVPTGLPTEAGARTIHYLLSEMLRQKRSGVALKDERTDPLLKSAN